MKAVRFNQFGGPEVLEIVDLPDPHPGPGRVRIAVRAAGVNPSDWLAAPGVQRIAVRFSHGDTRSMVFPPRTR